MEDRKKRRKENKIKMKMEGTYMNKFIKKYNNENKNNNLIYTMWCVSY